MELGRCIGCVSSSCDQLVIRLFMFVCLFAGRK